jgi:hypothetical protein
VFEPAHSAHRPRRLAALFPAFSTAQFFTKFDKCLRRRHFSLPFTQSVPCCSAEAPAASFFLNSLSQRDSRQDSRSHPLVADAASVKTTTKPHVCGADRNSLVLGGLISRWG